jgi:ribose 5-phosphate isomerase RpiB
MRLGIAADDAGFALKKELAKALCKSGHEVICLGARVRGSALARDLTEALLGARFNNAERYQRGLKKAATLEN